MLALQVPPGVRSTKITELNPHRLDGPVIVPGTASGLTVTEAVVMQVPIVYEIVAVPAETPVSIPEMETVAIAGAELVQAPPGTDSMREVELNAQILVEDGKMAVGEGLTVTVAEVEQVPKL